MKAPSITFNSVSVKVMRSHDYCHFEVALASVTNEPITPDQADDLRKCAARLADKAVEQYKIAKDHARRRESFAYEQGRIEAECREIETKPETERTPQEQATLKAHKDELFLMSKDYDYEEDWTQ